MSQKGERDYIYVIWKDPKSRRQYTIGELSKNGKYEFCYGHEIIKAIEKGFRALISFDDINRIYFSDSLFSSFASRLPDKKRKDIDKILSKYEMYEYDEYYLLKRSGGRLPIDTLEFIDPIPETLEKETSRYFYVAGTRHYIDCDGMDCIKSIDINKNDELILELEPENKYDQYAIKVLNTDRKQIGHIPRYHSEQLTRLINNGAICFCTVHDVNKLNNCNECIRIHLIIKKKDMFD